MRSFLVLLFLLWVPQQIAFSAETGASKATESLSGLGATTMRNLNKLLLDTTLSDPNTTPPASPASNAAVNAVVIATPPVKEDAPKVEHPFERLVEKSLGANLKVFGQNYFSGENATTMGFTMPTAVNVPADYAIAPGDELQIHAFGQISLDIKTVVDKEGGINLPQVGVLHVAGVSLKEMPRHVKSALSRYYKGFDVSVSLGQLRGAQVYVTGFAARPGSYNVSALSTVVNALFVSGGPSANGSMRAIELRRAGRTIAVLDMYQFLIFGDKAADVRVQSGDVIYVPPVKALVGVAGTVNAPAIYELKQETTIGDVLKYAGGVTTTGQPHQMTLERLGEDKGRLVQELTADPKTMGVKMVDGDMLVVLPKSPKFSNAVTLRGNVAMPIRYQWKEGMRITDLIPNQDALISPSFWLERNNSLHVSILDSGKEKHEVKQTFPEINWEYATIERVNMGALNTSLIPFNLGKAILAKDPQENVVLEAGDIITIFAKRDFRIPKAQLSKYVRVEGEVNRAGIYSVGPDEKIQDVILRAGGLSPHAYLFGAELRRESVREQQQKRMSDAADALEKNFQIHAMSRSRSVTTVEESASLGYESNSMTTLLERMRSVKAKGRVTLELKPGEKSLSALPALTLEDNDVIYVPPVPETIDVVGGVYNESSFLYKPNKTIQEYINQAGGFLPKADEDNIYVLRADGSVKVVSTKWFNAFNVTTLQPGDTIAVAQEFSKTSFLKDLKDWSQVMYQFILGVGGLMLLKGNL